MRVFAPLVCPELLVSPELPGSERGGRNATPGADRRERLAFRGLYPIQWSKSRIRSIP
jgi:hypothetical protein